MIQFISSMALQLKRAITIICRNSKKVDYTDTTLQKKKVIKIKINQALVNSKSFSVPFHKYKLLFRNLIVLLTIRINVQLIKSKNANFYIKTLVTTCNSYAVLMNSPNNVKAAAFEKCKPCIANLPIRRRLKTDN